MRTSLNKLQEIEQFIMQTGDVTDALVFEARMIIDPELIQQVDLQKETYTVIQQYGRRKLKSQLEIIHQQLFTQSRHQRFRQKIMALFKL